MPCAEEDGQGWWDMNVNAVGEGEEGDALAENSDAPKRKRGCCCWVEEGPALGWAEDEGFTWW